jgi:hypothetical protein
MLLKEMFSAIGAPKDQETEIDWLDDLKFFIDNDTDVLSQHFFPAVKRHRQHAGNPNAFKVYIRPIERCKEAYCEKYQIENPDDKFPREKIIELAKMCAEEQSKIIERGDYEN